MRSGKRSVRLKVFLLLVVPLISVIGLWVFVAAVTVGDARQQLKTNTIADNLVLPIAAVQNQLPPEELLSMVAMGTRRPADRQALAVQRAHTDGALGLLRTAVASDKVRNATSVTLRQELDQFLQTLTRLTDVRGVVDDPAGQRLQVVQAYTDLANVSEGLQEDISVATLVDVQLYRKALPLINTGNGTALLSSEQAILTGALSAGARSLDQAETQAFAEAVYNHRLVLEKLVAARVTPDLGTALQDILTSAPYVTLTLLEDRIIATPPGSPIAVDPRAFQGAAVEVLKDYAAVTRPLGLGLADRAVKAGQPVIIRLVLAGGLGLVAVLLSLLLSLRFGRGLAKELTGLQAAAQNLADQRLPRIVERLRNDEVVDVDAEAPPLVVGDTAEVARVGDAFTTVQRTAIEAAIGQANLRRGVRQVFLNLARRSQSLLHRQLTMLDAMERKTNDPDALDELFRLDHLTTRMRRHAEGLIILSGALPARAWSTPVRVVDVVRAAIAEVESYTRVRVYVLSEASLQGTAVADVTHLIAELVENAASFSPPHTQVQVRAETVGNGFVVEIEDAGLGMPPDQLADVNGRLARPPDFDLADTDRLGLFVVAQLAARHNIKVTLRPSPYGGTTAIVLLPAELMAQEALPGGDADSRGRLRTGGRRGPGGSGDAELELPAIDGDPDTPALTGRHRRLAGFLQRTRALQAPDPGPPPAGADRPENGHPVGVDGNGWYPAEQGGNGSNGTTPAAGWSHGGTAGSNGWESGPDAGTSFRSAERPADQPADRFGDPARPPYDRTPNPAQYRERADRAARADRAGEPTDSPPRRYDQPTSAGGQSRSYDQPGDHSGAQPPARGYQPPAYGPPSPEQPAGSDPAGYQQPRYERYEQPGYEPVPAPRPAADAGQRGWDASKFDLWATTESSATSSGTHAGLPRRVRRASLAPQLRDAPVAGAEDDVDQGTETLRSPEQARALMNSLQSGWRRGRTEADPASPPTQPTEEPR